MFQRMLAPQQKAGVRNGLVDASRLVAAAGIVWFHSEAPGEQLADAGVPFFLVLLCLSGTATLQDRARRLLLPFAVWSAIYAAFRVLLAVKTGQDSFASVQPWMVLTGPSLHLWFLPFAFGVAVLARGLPQGNIRLAFPVLAAIVLCLLPQTQAPPLYQYSFGIVPALVGLACLSARWLALVPLVLAVAILEWGRPAPDNLTILIGSALAILVLSVQLPAGPRSQLAARLATWVYLRHVLVIHHGASMGLEGVQLALCSIAGALFLAALIEVIVARLRDDMPQIARRQ